MAKDNVDIPPFQEYSKAPVFRNLENVSGFSLLIELPQVVSLADAAAVLRLGNQVYNAVFDVLDAAGFHHEDRLHAIRSSTRVGVSYDDDEYGFEAYFDTDGDFNLIRSGSSFERFHNWYLKVMPSIESLVSVLLVALADEAAPVRSYDTRSSERKREIRPLRAQYAFRFVGYNFRSPPSDEVERNFFVMRRLFGGLPSELGSLTAEPDAMDKFGRTDYAVSRWTKSGERYAREVYTVEAPGNRRFSSIWLNFSYIGETYDMGDGVRLKFEPTDFLKYYEVPYVEFLKNRALEAFVAGLTKNMTFETSAGTLP